MDDIVYEIELQQVYNKLDEIEPEFCRWLRREKLRLKHPPTHYQNLPILLHPYPNYNPPPHVAFDVAVTAAAIAPSAGRAISSSKGKGVMQVNAVDRPAWLPLDWKYDERERTAGKTRGLIDKFYISPDKQTFRSRVAVLRYLEWQRSLLDGSKGKEGGAHQSIVQIHLTNRIEGKTRVP